MAERQTAAPKREGKQVKVTLAKAHTHRGQVYPAGAEIELWPDQAERLRRHKKVKE